MEWMILGGYTLLLCAIFFVVHRQAVEGYRKVAKQWEIKYQKLMHEHQSVQERLEDRNHTVEFLQERLAEMETVTQEICPEIPDA